MDEPAALDVPGEVGRPADLDRERVLRELVECVAVTVNQADTTGEVLQGALRTLGGWSGWPVGEAVLFASDGGASERRWWTGEPDRYSALRDAAFVALSPYLSASEGACHPSLGVEPLQLRSAPLPSAGPLLDAGLALACVVPLHVGGRAVGVLQLYSPAPAPDLSPLLEVVGTITSLIGRTIERRRSTLARERELHLLLREARSHDPLTGLPDRTLFAERVARALERAHRHGWSTAVLAVDLDDFGAINDRFGAETTDRMLVTVAQRLQSVVRPYDGLSGPHELTARVGGDEFLLLCENVDADAAASVAQRVLTALAEPLGSIESALTLTATIGIGLSGSDAVSPLTLIADAQAARRHTKQNSSASFAFFSEGLRVASRARTAMTQQLEQALQLGQLVLHYQPQVLVATGRVHGVEALIRWEHPQRGLVPPLDFIPVAETTGLIVPLGAWVLQEACHQAARWRKEMPDHAALVVSVNVSARQFRSDLIQTVRTALSSSGLDPAGLVLEVTESVVMDDVDYAVDVLRGVKDLGVCISIDDFGTGYSSLAYLKRLPLDELKIDRSFINGLGSDPEDTAIAAAVTAMAHALGLQVVAEGVETPLQLDRLRALGCDAAQGYYFSRPLPASALTEMFTSQPFARARNHDGAPNGAPDVILVADDSPEIRQLAVVSLSTAGFDVHEATDGRAALELARKLRPDCLVLDVQMPHLTGYEVCRALRADPALAACTVVMLTSGSAPQDKLDGYAAGADDYLVKPFTPRELVTRVTHAMTARATSMHSRT